MAFLSVKITENREEKCENEKIIKERKNTSRIIIQQREKIVSSFVFLVCSVYLRKIRIHKNKSLKSNVHIFPRFRIK